MRIFVLALGAAWCVVGCSDPAVLPNDAAAADAAQALDGATDGGDASVDAAIRPDVGLFDAETDGGQDAAVVDDVGLTDAAVSGDGAAGLDDAGSADDASTTGDAGATDAGPGVDAGPVTTCSIDVTPSSGTAATVFTVTTVSNGTACMIEVDGPSMTLSVACTGSFTSPGSLLPPGTHTVTLVVAGGPGGSTRCSTTASIVTSVDAGTPDAGTVDAGPVTTCAVDVTPSSGTTTTTFTGTFTSNGSACIVFLDAFSLGPTPCTSTASAMGSLAGPGMHTLTLNVTAGPGGPSSCSDSFEVLAP